MAPRRSATKTEARERARRAAAETMAREQRLLELGEEYFVAQGEAEQILEAAEQRIAQIRTKAAQDVAETRQAQTRVVAGMKKERVAVAEIAQRLELSAAVVRAMLKGTPAGASTNAADDAGADGDAVAGEATEAPLLETVGV